MHDAGWDALRRGEGGVSSLVLWDSEDGWLYFYDDWTIQAAARHLESADVLVGYSSEKFDVPCVEGLVGRRLALRHHLDMYTELAKVMAREGFVGTKGDMTLDRVCRRSLGRGKIEHGSHAKQLAEAGRWAQLWGYCADDVHLTRDLFHYACEHGGIVGPRGFRMLELPSWVTKAGLEATS
jgi:DEAD/DEAH box helicase domain-containing protein